MQFPTTTKELQVYRDIPKSKIGQHHNFIILTLTSVIRDSPALQD